MAPGQQQSREEISSANKTTLNFGHLHTSNLTWWREEGGSEEGRKEGEEERKRGKEVRKEGGIYMYTCLAFAQQ